MSDAPAADLSSAVADPERSEGNPWSWAAYLGASWTWCIGMFLPVLLIRDYGPWAWVIFAIPNAVGAAAMGWVMRSRQMSHDYTLRHASACRLFSFVTIAFQLFFSIWMLPRLIGPVGYVGSIILVQSAFTPVTKMSWLRTGGTIALIGSTFLAAGLVSRDALVWPSPRDIDAGDALGLSLVCLAGFLTCPYLDLTFHRARQSTNGSDAKFAFGIGFCVLFFAMIVLTYFYASKTLTVGINGISVLEGFAAVLLAVHLLLQMTYTVHVHAAELQRQASARDDLGAMRAGLGLWLAIALALIMALAFAASHGLQWAIRSQNRDLGEAGYRVFMSFYGLLFPVYVLLAIGGRRVSMPAWLLISAAATPFYWLAFLEGKMAWAAAGIAMIALGALLARRFTPAAPALPSE